MAHGQDPAMIVFDQIRHLGECFENGYMEPFPLIKNRRIKERVKREKTVPLYCKSRLPESDNSQCDTCQEWYHFECLDTTEKISEECNWSCQKCSK